MAKIGVQMMTVKKRVAEEGLESALTRLSAMGYQALEMSQIPMTEQNVHLLEDARAELGLEVGAISAILRQNPKPFADALDTDYDKLVSDARRLQCRYMRIGMMPLEAMATYAGVEEFSAEIEAAAQKLARDGITLCYHNHHVDLAAFDGERIFDIVRRLAPSVHFEIDLFWLQRGGANPQSVLRQYAGVVDLIHLKDYAVVPLPLEALEARAAGDMTKYTEYWNGIVHYAPVGSGNMEWPELIPTALESGASYLFVEQDDLYDDDAYVCLQKSKDYLDSIGYGAL